MKKQLNISLLWIPVLAFGLMFGAATVLAQPEMPGPDVLAPLKHALQAAGAAELTSDQESNIQALIQEFREAHQRPLANADIPDARNAYVEAILNGDSAKAASEAETIAKSRLDAMVQREADAAAFAVNVIGILKAGSGQVDALTTQMGTRGFVRLILSLVNPPGRGGPGRGGPRAGRGAPPEFPMP